MSRGPSEGRRKQRSADIPDAEPLLSDLERIHLIEVRLWNLQQEDLDEESGWVNGESLRGYRRYRAQGGMRG